MHENFNSHIDGWNDSPEVCQCPPGLQLVEIRDRVDESGGSESVEDNFGVENSWAHHDHVDCGHQDEDRNVLQVVIVGPPDPLNIWVAACWRGLGTIPPCYVLGTDESLKGFIYFTLLIRLQKKLKNYNT